MVVLTLINLGLVFYIYKELKRREKLFNYSIGSLQFYVDNFKWYQDAFHNYVDEVGKHIKYQHDSIVEYQDQLAKSIKDLPKEIAIKNYLKIP